jgi:hypothetical protein
MHHRVQNLLPHRGHSHCTIGLCSLFESLVVYYSSQFTHSDKLLSVINSFDEFSWLPQQDAGFACVCIPRVGRVLVCLVCLGSITSGRADYTTAYANEKKNAADQLDQAGGVQEGPRRGVRPLAHACAVIRGRRAYRSATSGASGVRGEAAGR